MLLDLISMSPNRLKNYYNIIYRHKKNQAIYLLYPKLDVFCSSMHIAYYYFPANACGQNYTSSIMLYMQNLRKILSRSCSGLIWLTEHVIHTTHKKCGIVSCSISAGNTNKPDGVCLQNKILSVKSWEN